MNYQIFNFIIQMACTAAMIVAVYNDFYRTHLPINYYLFIPVLFIWPPLSYLPGYLGLSPLYSTLCWVAGLVSTILYIHYRKHEELKSVSVILVNTLISMHHKETGKTFQQVDKEIQDNLYKEGMRPIWTKWTEDATTIPDEK